MRSGLRNADVKLAPGGEVSQCAPSRPEAVGRTKAAEPLGAERSAAHLTTPVVVAVSANSASQSYVGTANITDAVASAVSESPVP